MSLCYFFRSSGKQLSLELKPSCEVKKEVLFEELIPYARLLDLSAATIKTRLERGDSCYLAFIDGQAVHRSWVTSTPCWVKDAKAIFRPLINEFYVYDSYTLPRYRSRGAFTSTLIKILADYQARGSFIWIAARNDNFPSRRAIEKVGFEKIFAVNFRKFLFFKHYEFLRVDQSFSEEEIKERVIIT